MNFPLRDLARRKFETVVTILGISLCVSITVYAVLFGENLGIKILSFSGIGISGFLNVFTKFLMIIISLSIIASISVNFFLVTIMTSKRTRDIGIMKAVGCLTHVGISFFSTELLIVVFTGCSLGTLTGVALAFVSVGLLNRVGTPISSISLNVGYVAAIFLIYFFLFYITGLRQIGKAVNAGTIDALSPTYRLKTRHAEKSNGKASRLMAARMSIKMLDRRRSLTIQIMTCLFLLLALFTVTVVGGVVANETTQSYVRRAMGDDVILVAHPNIAEQYGKFQDRFLADEKTIQMEPVDYLTNEYIIAEDFVSRLRAIDGVLKVDPRLMVETEIQECQDIYPDPDDPQHYVVIGDNRRSFSLVIGIEPDSLVNNWMVFGEKLNQNNIQSVLIGDNLGLSLFQDPLRQSVKMFNIEFHISGLVMDPLNNGKTVYTFLNSLRYIVGCRGYNIILLQTRSQASSIVSEIETHSTEAGLSMLVMNRIVIKQSDRLQSIWDLMIFLSLFSFSAAVISLASYLVLTVSDQQQDFGIMSALGAKNSVIIKIVLFEVLFLVLVAVSIGLPIGAMITFVFLIPEIVMSETTVFAIFGISCALIGSLAVSGVLTAIMTARAKRSQHFE